MLVVIKRTFFKSLKYLRFIKLWPSVIL